MSMRSLGVRTSPEVTGSGVDGPGAVTDAVAAPGPAVAPGTDVARGDGEEPGEPGPAVTRITVTGGGLLVECRPCRVYLELGPGACGDLALRAFADCHPPTLGWPHRKDVPPGWAVRLAGALSQ